MFVVVCSMSSITVMAQDGWTPLYNGTNLDGWEHVGPGEMVIEDGLIKTVGGMGLLWFTGQKFGNAVIRVMYKIEGNSNAGVFIRIPEQPTEPWMPVHKGFEVQIDDTQDANHLTGVLYSFTKARAKPGVPGWNTLEITLKGDQTLVHVNGVLVTDFSEGDEVPPKKIWYEPERGPRTKQGYIGLQNHGEEDVVFFKEVSYKLLDSDN